MRSGHQTYRRAEAIGVRAPDLIESRPLEFAGSQGLRNLVRLQIYKLSRNIQLLWQSSLQVRALADRLHQSGHMLAPNPFHRHE